MNGVDTLLAPNETSKEVISVRSRIKVALRRWSRVFVVVLGLAILGGRLGHVHRYFDDVSHFQVQFLIGAVVLFVVLLVLRSPRWALVAMVCLGWTSWRVVPWFMDSSWTPEAAAAERVPRNKGIPEGPGNPGYPGAGVGAGVRIMLFNVLQTNDRYADVVAHIEAIDPDLIVLEEINNVWLEALQSLGDTRPYVSHQPGGALRGLAIFSKYPLEQMELQPFGDPTTISLSGVMRVRGKPVHFVVTHPWPPSGVYGYNSRNAQLQQVAHFMSELPEPKFLIGDLNLSMWSVHYESLIATSGLVNARKGFGVLPTFPMDSYYVLRVPIDHCLFSPDVQVVNCFLGEASGSDHAPLVVEIALP